MYKEQAIGGTKNKTEKKEKIKKQKQLSSLKVYILDLYFIGIIIAWLSVV